MDRARMSGEARGESTVREGLQRDSGFQPIPEEEIVNRKT